MLWKVEQNRRLARMAGLEAGLEAMETGIERKCKTDTWLGGGKPRGKLQQRRDLARMRQASRLWKLQQRRDLAKVREDSRQASTPTHT